MNLLAVISNTKLKKRPFLLMFGICITMMLATSVNAEYVTFEWVTVDDLGNPGDSSRGGIGTVNHAYRISKHEVTNAQYAKFLNATVRGDLNLGYHPDMGRENGGIARAGDGTLASPYVYTTISGRENHPVNYVAVFWAQYFVHWLENSQPEIATSAAISYGAYPSFNGPRNPEAMYFLPSLDEWHKAAFYDPESESYFRYATGSNSLPSGLAPPGLRANDPSNVVNAYITGYAVTGSLDFDPSENYLTDVGAYPLAVSPYGTFDQNGNVSEWTEGTINRRLHIGGGWDKYPNAGDVLFAGGTSGVSGASDTGFRVASRVIVPEPNSRILLVAGLSMLFVRLRRERRS